jgi:hypothetical protein
MSLGRLEIVFGNPFQVPCPGVEHFSHYLTFTGVRYLWCGQFGIIWWGNK